MSPTPRKRVAKSADEPEKVAGETPEAEAKPKRARRAKAKPADTEAEATPAKAKAKAKAKPAPAAKAPTPAAKAPTAPAAEPDDEPAKTQRDKAADEGLVAADVEDSADAEAAPAATKPRRARRAKADETPAEPALAPKRSARDPNAGPPMVRAHAKYVRTSARKARLVCDHIRGKSVEEARAILAHANRDVARDWTKLLESAVANAEHNHELVGDELRIHAVKADEGPTLKRFRPRAMGRATPIRKRTSHLSITLTPKDGDR